MLRILMVGLFVLQFHNLSSQNATSLNSTDSGIKFNISLSWQQVLEKAKSENKYIFVDCYTTWCKPCREMEKFVYPLDTVGDFFNKNFISIKLQMDTTKNDSEQIKGSYS